MNTTDHKPASESARVSDEKTSKCKALAGVKLSSDRDILLKLHVSGDTIRFSGKFRMVGPASIVLSSSKSKGERKTKHYLEGKLKILRIQFSL